MTKTKIKTIIQTSLIGAAVLTAFPACSDTWNDHYNAAGEFNATATETLWEQIQANPKLTQFAQILEKAHYYKDENHKMANYTFKDMLNSTQILTVWAPEDGTYDAEKWLEMCGTDKEYTVQQQFLGNHIALWRQIANITAVDTLTMLNSKRVIFDKGQKKLQGITITENESGKEIGAKNGVLYTLNGSVPFLFNLYEYIKSTPSLSQLAAYITSKDTVYFNTYASTEGPSDENGNPTYVDSVFYTRNLVLDSYSYMPSNAKWATYLEGMNARLNTEDSAYAVILPTDQAWQAAREKLNPYYNYAEAYVNKTEQDQQVDEDLVINPDSLKELCLNMDLTSPLAFNIKGQPREGVGVLTKETFDTQKNALSYLVNTKRDTLQTLPTWNQMELFDGQEPVSMSNGLAYIVNSWNYPVQFYKPDITVEAGYASLFDMQSLEGKTLVSHMSFDNLKGDWVLETGKVHEESYLSLEGNSATASPFADFKIRDTEESYEIMSGKYDVYVVMVPYYYRLGEDMRESEDETLKAQYVRKNRFEASITFNNGPRNPKDNKVVEKTLKTGIIEYEGLKMDTLLLFENFEFPYSYKNLRNCYPTIQIKDRATATNLKNGYTHTLSIDRFLFVSKED